MARATRATWPEATALRIIAPNARRLYKTKPLSRVKIYNRDHGSEYQINGTSLVSRIPWGSAAACHHG